MNIREKLKKVDHEAFYKSPQDYVMPGKSIEELYKLSKLPINILEIIDKQFRISYGMVVDFKNRLNVIDNMLNDELGNSVISDINGIYPSARLVLNDIFERDFIQFDLSDKINLPKITREIIKLFYGQTFSIRSFVDGLIESLPVLNSLCITGGKEKFVKALKNKNYEKSLSIFDEVELLAHIEYKKYEDIEANFQIFMETIKLP